MTAALQLYRPSNGHEGELFYAVHCQTCIHDAAHRDSGGHEPGCTIYIDTCAYEIDNPNYLKEWIISINGEPMCTAWADEKGEQAPRCALTPDLFEAVP